MDEIASGGGRQYPYVYNQPPMRHFTPDLFAMHCAHPLKMQLLIRILTFVFGVLFAAALPLHQWIDENVRPSSQLGIAVSSLFGILLFVVTLVLFTLHYEGLSLGISWLYGLLLEVRRHSITSNIKKIFSN